MESERFFKIIRKIAEEMYLDYNVSKRSSVVRIREELYQTYYEVKPLELGAQDKPVVFVDAGFRVFETDIATLLLVNVGARIRSEDGNLLKVSEISDYPPIETYFIYGRIVEESSSPEFKVEVIPADEDALLLSPQVADEVSSKLTKLVNERFGSGVPRGRALRLFKRLVKYLEGLLEEAYAIRVGGLVTRSTIKVVDGTLVRWFGLKQLRVFRFEGIDVLSLLTGLSRDALVNELRSIYGLVKTTKFTSIARARSIFKRHGSAGLGLYGVVTESSVRGAAEYLNKLLKSGEVSKETVEEAINVLVRVAHPLTGVWVAKFPITTDGINVMYIEVHIDKPPLNLSTNIVEPDTRVARELHERVSDAVNNVVAYRSAIEGNPPYGFMEVDRDVRLETRQALRVEDAIVLAIRDVAGELGHPLELVFRGAWRMRLGYR